MIFPWADGGDLDTFWSENPSTPPRNCLFAKWMSKQILGLASALDHIHNCTVPGLCKRDRDKMYGRHGDIKPANILWFRSPEDSSSYASLGTLKISDFGFVEFNGPNSKSHVPTHRLRGLSSNYRAPEFDVGKEISPRYDIYSFGCVLLELLAWHLLGYEEGITAFTDLRMEQSTAITQEDNFFNLYSDKDRHLAAQTKLAVREVCVLK
jgi:serine/threonine protein kinase